MGLILLDTTVLVYATGVEHRLRAPCRAVIEAVGDSRLTATTTAEVIQEFAHVRARRDGRSLARQQAALFVELLDPFEVPSRADVERGLELFERHDSLGVFDAVLAACVLGRVHLDGVLSADRGFDAVAGLRRYDPADDDDLADLGVTR